MRAGTTRPTNTRIAVRRRDAVILVDAAMAATVSVRHRASVGDRVTTAPRPRAARVVE